MRKSRAKQIRRYTRNDTPPDHVRTVYRARKKAYNQASGSDKQKLREEMS